MENNLPPYTPSPFRHHRRETRVVDVGGIPLGGSHPIRIQSMTNIPTLETEACVQQIVRLAEAGCDYVRLATPRAEDAHNLSAIRKRLQALHCHIPLIADVHFTPEVAEIAAERVEKVRINPGNYTDRKIRWEYSDQEYREALEKTADRLLPLLNVCRRNGTALRIGTNHGSLSPRIVSRYGDTPLGMAMSALEFVGICEDFGFHQIVISMKASNVRIMTESVRLLVALLDEKGWNYPLHLGVTEAGNGAYGRIKSTAGILPLLYDGLGDTIRVSLTEAPEKEVPVARTLAALASELQTSGPEESGVPDDLAYDPYRFHVRKTVPEGIFGRKQAIVVSDWAQRQAEACTPADLQALPRLHSKDALPNEAAALVLESPENEQPLALRAFFNRLLQEGNNAPVIIRRNYRETERERFYARATADFATLFADGFGNGVWISNPHFPEEEIYQLSLHILQACGIRFDQAEYIACPSCGRTQYNIEKVLHDIRLRTKHLRNLKIGVMGCIVNGPGEMADADYGFVGCGGGKVSLYKGKQAIYQQVPQEEGIERLIQLIKENGDWTEPEA
ncbi:MAG: (E)-4-hydroxy-3-methylbut-2-enyl-diphosphate synthase [Bacteroidales bacterium]|nr:(E)-4-hydroxy-3-methylbut-2-enyl-diphosphate synthase [Bacteroidales bacterium]